MDDREQKIRERAYQIWEDEGRPEGGHDDHWRRAEEQLGGHEHGEAKDQSVEKWKVEAGLADEKPKLDIASTVIAPD